jgi:hypothetical protein
MTPSIIIGELCPYCQKHRSPADFIRHPAGIKICTSCEQRHLEALHTLSTGEFTGECSECGLKPDELRARGLGDHMAVHFENGRYRMMCLRCDQTYTPKRRELYQGTEFARQYKLQ